MAERPGGQSEFFRSPPPTLKSNDRIPPRGRLKQGDLKLEEAQTAYFLDRYSRMTDEELSYLLVTRGDSLSEEAGNALRIVLSGRNPSGIRDEIRATAADVGAQVERAKEEARKKAESERATRTGVRFACIGLFVIGLFVLMLGPTEGGTALCVAALAIFLYFEIHRLIRRFFAALVNPDSR